MSLLKRLEGFVHASKQGQGKERPGLPKMTPNSAVPSIWLGLGAGVDLRAVPLREICAGPPSLSG